MSDLTRRRADDLLALHGVGPAAIVRLRAALAERGLSFLGEGGWRDLRRS